MENTSVTVTLVSKCIIHNASGEILVLRRNKDDPRRPLTWDLPGGTVEQGEDPIVAAQREVKEESGQEIENLNIIATHSRNEAGYIINFIFEAASQSNKVTLSFEHDSYKWASLNEVQSLDIPEKYKEAARLIET
jgi:8-oxo-dGTP diphosphatase